MIFDNFLEIIKKLPFLIIGCSALCMVDNTWAENKAFFRGIHKLRIAKKMFWPFLTRREWDVVRLYRMGTPLSKKECQVILGKLTLGSLSAILIVYSPLGWYLHEACHFLVGNLLGTARITSFNNTNYTGDYSAIVALAGPALNTLFYALFGGWSPTIGIVGLLDVIGMGQNNYDIVSGQYVRESDIDAASRGLNIHGDTLSAIIYLTGIAIYGYKVIRKVSRRAKTS